MRRILIVLLMMAVGVAHARILHVGENTIKLSQTKTTTPALHVRVGDEVWYGVMCTNNQKNTLHVKFNNIVYDVIEPFTDTTNYIYDESGRLIGANENLYMNIKQTASGKRAFDTGVIANLKQKIQLGFKVGYSNGCHIFGTTKTDSETYDDLHIYRIVSSGNAVILQAWGTTTHNYQLSGPVNTLKPNTKYNYEFGNMYLKDLDTGKTLINSQPPATDFLWEPGTWYTSSCNSVWLYNLKIYEDDVLVRHFVPVPCGLKIGDFVVPENGMWDIVEQKFYGNMGTGEFIYGVD